MQLNHMHAYEVRPQRISGKVIAPRGGEVLADDAFKKLLDDFFAKAKFANQPLVAFNAVDPPSGSGQRTNEVRSLITKYIYEKDETTTKSCAYKLAKRLGRSMDDRSPFTLLLLTAFEDNETRSMVLWAFPRDEPLHFSTSGTKTRIRVLKNAFSRSSNFRKAAFYEGEDLDDDFWDGRVVDNSGESGTGGAADFWVSRFLDSRSEINSEVGSRLLAKYLKATYDHLKEQDEKDEIANAIVNVHSSKRKQWSFKTFASEYLSAVVGDLFIEKAPLDLINAKFAFNEKAFDERLNFRVFRLESNVVVYAPFGEVGDTVKLSDGKVRRLVCAGNVVSEKLKSKNAG